jgi:hypothetical protein
MMSRCQRRIVSGVTTSRSLCRWAFGVVLDRVTRRATLLARAMEEILGTHK